MEGGGRRRRRCHRCRCHPSFERTTSLPSQSSLLSSSSLSSPSSLHTVVFSAACRGITACRGATATMVKGMRRPKAASGASKAASGARPKVRVSGLWGLRHWVRPDTKDVVMAKLDEIMVKHKDPKPNKRKIKAYRNEVGQVLSACRPKSGPSQRGSNQHVKRPITPRGPSQRRDRESNEPSQRRDHESEEPRHQRGCESQEPSQRRARDPKEPSQRRVPTLCLDLEPRLRNAYKPREKVVMRTPRTTPTAAFT